MASNLRVDTILPSTGTNVAIGTANGSVTFLGDTDITTSGDVTIGGNASISGNLGIGGTLTYEDVTNIDSVGLITARSGINISSGSLTIPDSIIHSGDINTKIRFPEADAVTIETNGSERLRINSAGSWGIGANFGTSGQVLTSQGNSSAPTWATPSGGLFASYAQVCDRKSSGSHGGSFASGDWRTRELNTEAFDPDGIVTLSSNQFTLQAGSYFINAMAPAQSVVNHQLRLRNITDSNNALFGFSAYASQSSGNATDDNDYAFLKGRITLSGAKTFELQHRCNTTRNGAGFGQPSGYAEETYASVEIYKEN